MKHVAIRLDDSKYRRLRVLVAQRGLTLQQAVESALDQYMADVALPPPPRAPNDYRGFLRDTDVMEMMEQDRQAELTRNRRRL